MNDPFQARRNHWNEDDLSTWDDMRLAYRLYRDPRVSPLLKWIVPVLAAVYVVAPIDIIPDVLLGIGQMDDLGVLGIAFFIASKVIRRLAPDAVVDEHIGEMRGRSPRSSTRGASARDGDVIETTFRVDEATHQP